ncbi:hypothetical protein Vqi01_01280 [Micromonospora qiuiae]|uniref:Uncharacterized protein n=1 Tax=Micromonospora qiuiae TaxID=502268 RepID=A0ABQ4J4K2_9ACTN|nr:hypothetical protein Vqi01_01280 [Micromonospora qiuiae]
MERRRNAGSDPVGETLVRRYLAAFGPADTADLRAWCGLTGLRGAVAAIREQLVAFRDERGRELLDRWHTYSMDKHFPPGST